MGSATLDIAQNNIKCYIILYKLKSILVPMKSAVQIHISVL